MRGKTMSQQRFRAPNKTIQNDSVFRSPLDSVFRSPLDSFVRLEVFFLVDFN